MADGWAALALQTTRRHPPLVRTPYADPEQDQLRQLTWQLLFGTDSGPGSDAPLTRAEAMALPALARARHLLCSTAGRTPLTVYGREGKPLEDQPAWVDPLEADAMPGFHRMVWTADDLLFYGASVWKRANGHDGFPLRMDRLPRDQWIVDPDSGELLDPDGKPYAATDVTFIPGPHEGILSFGQVALRLARDVYAATREQAARPFRLELHQTSEAALTRTERAELVNDARAALRTNGGVLFTNAALEAKVHPLQAGDLLTTGREASARDLARLADVPAGMVDAPAGDSMTYATVASRLREFLAFGASSYLTAITARLSMGDVTPRGQRVHADTAAVLADLAEDGAAAPQEGPAQP